MHACKASKKKLAEDKVSKQQFTVVEPGQFKEEKPILTGYVGDLLAVRLVKAGWANKLDHIVTEMRERGLPGQFFFTPTVLQ